MLGMNLPRLPATLSGYKIHLTGIKGTGMVALAEILVSRGAVISGSDVAERFYTDELLQRLGIPYSESFDRENIGPGVRLVVHSAAYDRLKHPELIEAAARGIPILSYPQVLGLLSEDSDSSGVAGTHGKTTTAALAGTLLSACGVPATVLAGSEVESFGNRSTMILGDRYFVAETCEYRRHFLYFHPRRVILTGVEADHLDYFKDLEDVLGAFVDYCLRLPAQGQLIFNHDDSGSREVSERVGRERKDIELLPFGRTAEGPYRIVHILTAAGETRFRLLGQPGEIVLKIPGAHSAFNAAAAVALCLQILRQEGRALESEWPRMQAALESFRGSRRRSETVGRAAGVLFLDDYGHHPTEIAATLAGLKSFYPGRRIVVDFMPHTYSRTRALLSEFARCFGDADLLVLHDVYASAREKNRGKVNGGTLFAEVKKYHPQVHYFRRSDESLDFLLGILKRGDVFMTMGAGDNWKIGRELLARLGKGEP